MNSPEMLVLFCSTFRARYAQDILSVIAYPTGAIFHFRYQRRWVSDALASENLERLIGLKVLCCMVDGTGTQCTYLPLRLGDLVEIQREGEIFHIYFRVGNVVHWQLAPFSKDGARLQELLDSADQRIKDTIPNALRPPTKFCSLTRAVDFIRSGLDVETEPTESWQSLVTVLATRQSLKGAVFFKVDSIEVYPIWLRWWERFKKLDSCEETRAQPITLPVQEVQYLSAGFEIRKATLHALKISYYQPDEHSLAKIPRHHVTIVYDSDFFYWTSLNIDILSQFDTVRTMLYPTFGTYAALTPITLRVEKKDGENDTSDLLSPEVTLPLKLLHPRRVLVTSIGLFLIGALFHIGTNADVLKWLAPALWNGMNDIAQKAWPVIGTGIAYICYFFAIIVATRRVATSSG